MKEKRRNKIIAGKKFQMQLSDLIKYLADFSPQTARNMRSTIKENLGLLELYPQLGKLLDCGEYGERRILIVKKYIILYTYRNETVHLDMFLDEKMDYYHYI